MTPAFVGIDVAFAKQKKLPICISIFTDGRLTPLPLTGLPFGQPPRGSGNVATLDQTTVSLFADDTLGFIQSTAAHYDLDIQTIAIDAPRNFSFGTRRSCEQAMDSMGISCFATPSRSEFDDIRVKVSDHLASGGAETHLPHSNQLWMLVGFALFERLEQDYNCLEVFPQATVRAIGAGQTHKSKRDGVQQQLALIAQHTGWHPDDLEDHLKQTISSPLHDALDAFMCAWVASLYPDKVSPCGELPSDVIWIPNVIQQQQITTAPIKQPGHTLDASNKVLPRRQPTTNTGNHFRDGSGKTTVIGYINRNNQKCLGTRGVLGNGHGALSYKLYCLNGNCGHKYGANGTDVFLRKCPKCQSGRPGINF